MERLAKRGCRSADLAELCREEGVEGFERFLSEFPEL
jgi:hypothetical protein